MLYRRKCSPTGSLTIEAVTHEVGRKLDRFGTAHLMFTRIDDSYERALDEAAQSLSVRYARNMRPATERYGAIGTPSSGSRENSRVPRSRCPALEPRSRWSL